MLPWSSLAANTVGTVKACCMSEGIVLKPDGTPYNLATDSIMEIFHSDHMKNMRQEFLDGGKPVECRRCWNEEDAGRVSKRQTHLHKMNMILPMVNFDTLEPRHLLYLDLKLGNICNLKCRICSPMVSSTYAQEDLMQVPYAERKTHQSKTWLVDGEWPRTSKAFWDELRGLIPKVKFFDFTGGEPFMIQEHFDVLRYSVEQGSSRYQHLFYNTNGTQFPEQAEELWKNFKRIEIAFSIDSIGKRFELERSGAKWDEVSANIQKFRELKTRLPHIELMVNATVSIQNIYYLQELCDWMDQQGLDNSFLGLVHFPEYLSIGTMPDSAKQTVIDHLESGTFSDKRRAEINKIITFIKQGTSRDGTEFRKKMKYRDEIRGENFADTHPEIAFAMNYDAT